MLLSCNCSSIMRAKSQASTKFYTLHPTDHKLLMDLINNARLRKGCTCTVVVTENPQERERSHSLSERRTRKEVDSSPRRRHRSKTREVCTCTEEQKERREEKQKESSVKKEIKDATSPPPAIAQSRNPRKKRSSSDKRISWSQNLTEVRLVNPWQERKTLS